MKNFQDFEKALELIGGSANLGAFAFWSVNQAKPFPNVRFVYTDGVKDEYLQNKWLIGLKVEQLMIGCQFPPAGLSYLKNVRFLSEYRSVLPVMPKDMTCRMASFEELKRLYRYRDEISLALLLMGKPVLSGKYWSRDLIENSSYLKIFDFDNGNQCYNGVTRENFGTEILNVLPILENKKPLNSGL